MRAYFDTSVLVPLYVPEPGTDAAEEWLRRAGEIVISRLVEVEFYSALARKHRAGEIAKKEADGVVEAFRRHIGSGVYTTLHVRNEEFTVAGGYLTRFRTALRTLDALHLASASLANATLLTADEDLAAAATVLGVGHELVPATGRL